MKKSLDWLKIHSDYIFLLVVAGFMRFFRLRDLTTFGGDQGVDYQRVAHMILERDVTLLGPVTHVGIYLGPLYYYLLVPFFVLFRFDPIAAPVLFAGVGTVTVALVYKLFQRFLNRWSSFLGAFLYSVSPVIFESSRAPSQPHLIPFFAVILLLSLLKVLHRQSAPIDGLLIGLSLGSLFQLHFLTYPLFFFTTIVLVFSRWKQGLLSLGKRFWLFLFASLITLLAPWILFEFRHQFFISKQVLAYLSAGELTIAPSGLLERALDIVWFAFDRLVGLRSQLMTILSVILSIAAMSIILARSSRHIDGLFLLIFAGIQIAGLAVYVSPLSNHYISSLYPIVILLTCLGAEHVLGKKIGMAALIVLSALSLRQYQPFRNSGYTMPEGLTTSVIQRASFLIAQNAPDRFEIANILDGDTRAQPYRYILSAVYQKPPMAVEEYPASQVLYVLARESQEEVLNHSVWEIASFAPKHIARRWEVGNNVFLYQLEKGR